MTKYIYCHILYPFLTVNYSKNGIILFNFYLLHIQYKKKKFIANIAVILQLLDKYAFIYSLFPDTFCDNIFTIIYNSFLIW